jgi:cell shape-determining protein MreC
MIVIVLIGYFIQKRLSDDTKSEPNWIDRQFIALVDSFFVRPTYIIADIFDVLKFNLFNRGIHIRNLKIDYERLKHEYVLLKTENKKLSHIIKYSPTYGKIIATGRILSDTNGFGVGVFTISVGLKDGVQFGDIVTTEQGLVGKIVKIYNKISIVLPVRHLSSKIIGRVQEQGSLVLMSGRHFKGAVVDYISDTVGLEKEQMVMSVSDGLSMPSGIPIGRIINPYNRPIEIALTVDFASLDYVTIVRNDTITLNSSETIDIFNQKSLPKQNNSVIHDTQEPLNPL